MYIQFVLCQGGYVSHKECLFSCSLQLTKINNPPWVFLTFFKLNKWYQIAQRITFGEKSLNTKTYTLKT